MAKKISGMVKALTSMSLVVLSGCAANEDERIGDAQFCMDKLPVAMNSFPLAERKAQVGACMAKLGDLQTKQSYSIRCAANFIIEGLSDPQRMIEVMKDLGNGQGGSGSLAMMKVLTFSAHKEAGALPQEDKVFAQQTLGYCQAAGNPGLIWVASISQMATSITSAIPNVDLTNIESLNDLSEEDFQAIVEAGAEAIGAAATIAHQTSCSGSDVANEELCSQLGAAIAEGMSQEEIGNALLELWKNQQSP